jgi:glycosyltransferase involved in cell wall biosynthesis
MRVLINTVPLYGNGPGLRTYTAGLLGALHASDADMQWHVILRPADAERLGLTGDARFRFVPASALAPLSEVPGVRFVWRNATDQLLAPAWAAHYDALHYLDSYGPVLGVRHTPVVLTVHDILPVVAKHFFAPWVAAYLGALMKCSIPRAAAILAVSAYTARQVSETLGVATERIIIAPNGLDAHFRRSHTPDEVQLVAERYGLVAPYIIYVGSINPRKNVARLVRAFTDVRLRHGLPHHLVLVGGLGWQYDNVAAAIHESGLGAAVHLLGRVPNEDVPLLMAGAECLAYPSLGEGFGLPILEAMACGVPVLAGAVPPLLELGQGAALLVDPESQSAIASGLDVLLRDADLRAELRQAGLRRAQEYSWARVAETALETYRRVSRVYRRS